MRCKPFFKGWQKILLEAVFRGKIHRSFSSFKKLKSFKRCKPFFKRQLFLEIKYDGMVRATCSV